MNSAQSKTVVSNTIGLPCVKTFISGVSIRRHFLVWIQAVLVSIHSNGAELVVDDGSAACVVVISPSTVQSAHASPSRCVGDYLLVQGTTHFIATSEEREDQCADTNNASFVINASRVHLLRDPNLESLWSVEVAKQML